MKKRVLVIGDIMLDKYVETIPIRLSDEAPVLIVKEEKVSYVLGGAGNTAANLKAMGFDVILQGVLGNDEASFKIQGILMEKQIEPSLVILVGGTTTIKNRFICKGNQLIRVDSESIVFPVKPLSNKEIDVIVISDYAKGVIGEETVRDIKENYKVPLIINGKPKNVEYYIGADVLVVNEKEADEILRNTKINPEDSYESIAGSLNILYVVVTKGSKGIEVYDSAGLRYGIEATAVEVKDITGAGDTVTAAIALELSRSGDINKAVHLANIAGGIKVTKDKTSEVSLEELKLNPENEGCLSTEQIIANLESDRLDG
jgi:D-beta-D-heptose 7-phosphate kinase/D-beta-D-heptose 1-phosphate adenosyltransferase